ncbi:unnamed protein product [Callosobruchus maculatus]|uniref:Uncharacterized protein n=1 Tax=Callosobruchus maculatus TaxID=64391 RepID=A0A653D5E1_CALMS|nr:unnamed protein product [Callosobruchus maculatus]
MRFVLLTAMLPLLQVAEGRFRRNLTDELLTYYEHCYKDKPFGHFAAMYDTLGDGQNYTAGVSNDDQLLIKDLIAVNPGRLKDVFSDQAVIDWKTCASEAYDVIKANHFQNYLRNELLIQWTCITSLVDKYLKTWDNPPTFLDYSSCYSRCEQDFRTRYTE